jgi:hypothetical protein
MLKGNISYWNLCFRYINLVIRRDFSGAKKVVKKTSNNKKKESLSKRKPTPSTSTSTDSTKSSIETEETQFEDIPVSSIHDVENLHEAKLKWVELDKDFVKRIQSLTGFELLNPYQLGNLNRYSKKTNSLVSFSFILRSFLLLYSFYSSKKLMLRDSSVRIIEKLEQSDIRKPIIISKIFSI